MRRTRVADPEFSDQGVHHLPEGQFTGLHGGLGTRALLAEHGEVDGQIEFLLVAAADVRVELVLTGQRLLAGVVAPT